MAGALSGIWLGEEIKQASMADHFKQDLIVSTDKIIELNSRIIEAQHLSATLAKLALEPFELQRLFKTNQSQLTAAGVTRVAQLALYLVENSELSVCLDGYADPRGNAQDNMQLSEARVGAFVGVWCF